MKLPGVKRFGGRRRRLWGDIPFRTRVVVLGVLLTTVVLVLEAAGALRPLEGWLYDTRARYCQAFSPPPTTQVVHLDIDDSALEAYGNWPWKRGRRIVGRAIDELREAGAKALALDITFGDEESGGELDYEDETPGAPATAPSTAPAGAGSVAGMYPVSAPLGSGGPKPVTRPTNLAAAEEALEALRREDEAALASAVERFGRVVLPTDFEIRLGRETELERVVREQLRLNLELTLDEMADWLRRFGGRGLRDVSRDALTDALAGGRKQVMLEKLMVAPNQPAAELLPRELGGLARTVRSPLQELVERKRTQARSVLAMERLYSREAPSEMPDLLVTRSQTPPIESLTAALARAKAAGGAGIIGSVNYADRALSPDGVVRSVPLLVNDRGRLLPQFGLALACTVLGVDPTNREAFTVTADEVVLSPPGTEPIVIPIYREPARGRVPAVGACFAIPWFGGRDWRTMYDWPRRAEPVNHVPFTLATTIGRKRADLRLNERNRELARHDVALLRRFGGLPPEADPATPFAAVLDETLKAAEFQITDLRKVPAAERQPDEVLMLKAADAVIALKANADALRAELEEARAKLRRAVEGKVVIVGSTASGGTADSVPTSLHGSCPGAVVHGVIYNAIVTRHMWRRAPAWVAYAIAIVFGGLMTWAVAKLTPWGSTVVAVLLGGAYVLLNAVLLFDWGNVVLGAAAPLSAVGLVWAGCTAASAGERFRINQMLHGYVDPKLVNYLNEHPENELFKTKAQEITVCFSDIEGFTTLTQQLGERMIPLLQDYLSRMVVVIRRHGGVVNKFMGDGIMFIFGVPERTGSAEHAGAALRCCLEMQEALERFNRERVPEGFPPLVMRVGVNTGMAYVGDAGPEDAREYTALGDTTNLAARLEPANKAFDTRVLVTEGTYLQTLNEFVFVPVGKLQVRGRREGTMTYELVCRTGEADEACRQRAEAVHAMILSYQQGVFDGCLKLIEAVEGRFGENRVCAVYRELCREHLEKGKPGDFHGQVRIG